MNSGARHFIPGVMFPVFANSPVRVLARACRGQLIRVFIAFAVCASGFNSGAAMAIEEPAFELIEKSEPYEIRQYRPFIVAETYVSGDLDAASTAGFRLIADYIFGNNLSVRGAAKSGGQASEKIVMTAPVAAEPVSEKIAMTAPVLAEPQAAAAGADMKATRWRIHFVMPSQYTLETLPRPVNPAVALRAVPGRRYAVVVFSGLAGAEKVQTKTDELLAWLRQRGLQARGAAQLARYNPPWTLPFFRRNEVMVELVTP